MGRITLILLFLPFITGLFNSSLKKKTHIINKGISGNNTVDLISRLGKDVISEQPDLVILMVGTNDMLWSKKQITYMQYSSNLDTIIKGLQKNNIDIVLVSPPPVDSIYLFERHIRKRDDDSPNKKLNKVCEILKSRALKMDLSFVDIFTRFSEMGIPIHNQGKIIRNAFNSGSRDGVHPTPIGYDLIAQEIFDVLVADKKIRKDMKILCLGDSITFGEHVAGEGTVSGDTYPSFLKEKIHNYQF